MNAVPPTLICFDVRGRAEPIRFVLEEVGESWKEQVVSLKDWDSEAPTTPFHRLPVFGFYFDRASEAPIGVH